MAKDGQQPAEIVSFLRKRDYKLVRNLGRGASGQTVLLHDDQIQEYFVCKKYLPYSDSQREVLFANFVREIKLLHQVHHLNVVRVFNYYLYPAQHAGYILMEYVDGFEIDEFVRRRPDMINELFLQAVSGFSHLENCGILHRDIRPGNLMVREDGVLKIIDLGFGKQVETSSDFDKSITLNWWCKPPDEFQTAKYDFSTEVYFVGRLFEQLLGVSAASHFKFEAILHKMCEPAPAARIGKFSEVQHLLQGNQFVEIDFAEEELETYREFARVLCHHIPRIEKLTKYHVDVEEILARLEDRYRSFMLEESVPDAVSVTRCVINGSYRYKKDGFQVYVVRDFLRLMKTSTAAKRRIVLGNLQCKLDAIPRYEQPPPNDDDVPF